MRTPDPSIPSLLAIAVLAGTLGLGASVAPAASDTIAGVWYDDSGKGAVAIEPCGAHMCGRIVWLQDPKDARGRPLTDGYNPDAGARRRPICGLQVIGNLKRQADGTWDAGWIYDPKVGKSYSVEIASIDGNRLKVTGYLAFKFMGKSFVWQRAPDALPVCTTS